MGTSRMLPIRARTLHGSLPSRGFSCVEEAVCQNSLFTWQVGVKMWYYHYEHHKTAVCACTSSCECPALSFFPSLSAKTIIVVVLVPR